MNVRTLLPDRRHVTQIGRNICGRLPESRARRTAIGALFVAGGTFSFLPLLGVWMLPVGFLILSIDFPRVRRMRRILEVRTLRSRSRSAAA